MRFPPEQRVRFHRATLKVFFFFFFIFSRGHLCSLSRVSRRISARPFGWRMMFSGQIPPFFFFFLFFFFFFLFFSSLIVPTRPTCSPSIPPCHYSMFTPTCLKRAQFPPPPSPKPRSPPNLFFPLLPLVWSPPRKISGPPHKRVLLSRPPPAIIPGHPPPVSRKNRRTFMLSARRFPPVAFFRRRRETQLTQLRPLLASSFDFPACQPSPSF